MTEEELRAVFERLSPGPVAWGHARSRRGTYVNPALARDWKWFRLGAQTVQLPDDAVAKAFLAGWNGAMQMKNASEVFAQLKAELEGDKPCN